MKIKTKWDRRRRIRFRIRKKVVGTAERPRLAVYRSLSHIYAQAIDDRAGHTIAAASSVEEDVKRLFTGRAHGGNIEGARIVGRVVAERLLAKGISRVVFDRGGFLYHGRVKALADAAREAGLKF